MASIEKRSDSTYRITVDYTDEFGKSKRERKTVKISKGLSQKGIEKFLEKEKVLFEEEVKNRNCTDGNIKIKDFAEKWINDYLKHDVSQKTKDQYLSLLKRIIDVLGEISLAELKPRQIRMFYNTLREEGIRADAKYCCKQETDLKQLILSKYPTLIAFSKKAGLNENTLRSAIQKNNVSPESAKKIADTLGAKLSNIFDEVKKDTLSERTIHHYHICLSAMLNTAVSNEYISKNPCNGIKSSGFAQKKIDVLSIDEAQEMLNVVKKEDIKYSTMIYLLIQTGMRRGEALGLKWSDIDFTENTIAIERALKYSPEKGLYIDKPKTNTSYRMIDVSDDILKLLNDYKEYQDNLTKTLGDARQKSEFIFTNEDGSHIRPDTLSNWFEKFCNENELHYVGIHGLRHSFATFLIEKNVSIAVISKILGHSRISTTYDIYIHSLRKSEKEAAETISNIFKSI